MSLGTALPLQHDPKRTEPMTPSYKWLTRSDQTGDRPTRHQLFRRGLRPDGPHPPGAGGLPRTANRPCSGYQRRQTGHMPLVLAMKRDMQVGVELTPVTSARMKSGRLSGWAGPPSYLNRAAPSSG